MHAEQQPPLWLTRSQRGSHPLFALRSHAGLPRPGQDLPPRAASLRPRDRASSFSATAGLGLEPPPSAATSCVTLARWLHLSEQVRRQFY